MADVDPVGFKLAELEDDAPSNDDAIATTSRVDESGLLEEVCSV